MLIISFDSQMFLIGSFRYYILIGSSTFMNWINQFIKFNSFLGDGYDVKLFETHLFKQMIWCSFLKCICLFEMELEFDIWSHWGVAAFKTRLSLFAANNHLVSYSMLIPESIYLFQAIYIFLRTTIYIFSPKSWCTNEPS